MTETAPRQVLGDGPAEWIVSIAQTRDRNCFVALFTRFAPKVKGYLLRHGAEEQVAEELAQETLFSVWRKAEQFDPLRASAAAWIYTIARNLYIDARRREHHPDERMAELCNAQTTPEEDLKAVEGEQRLRAAIDSLPPEQARVLKLSFFDEQTHVQIAEQLGLPLGTVKSRIRLAAAHLRSVLDGLA